MNENIQEIISHIGLNKNEAATFSVLLQYPDGISVLELSRDLNLPRPTIYSHLETFLKIGIAKKGLHENTSIMYPESKEIIESIFEEKIMSLKKSKEYFSSTFDNKKTATKFKPKFFVYEGQNAYEHVWRDILRTRQDSFWVWPVKGMLEKGISSEKLQEFHKERVKRNITMNVLWPEKMKLDIKQSPFLLSLDTKESLREIHILPVGLEQEVGYGIYGNKVAFISSGSENYAFVIESKELTKTLKNQFDFFWKISKKYS